MPQPIRPPRASVLCALTATALAAACAARAPVSAMPDPHAADPVGWYEIAPGHEVLVTWAPASDQLRLLDFDSARFSALAPSRDGAWVWRSGDEERVVTFERDRSDTVTALRWRGSEGGGAVHPRATEYPFDQQRVRFRNDSVELVGTMMIPRVRKLVGRTGETLRDVPIVLPAAVIIHGSGSSDRDNVWAFHIAQHVARSGVVVLLPDKRGSGGSGGDWRSADFEDLASDALAAAEVLARHPLVDSTRIGFIGLSQGGWIAPLAASRSPGAPFAVSISGAAVTPGEQVRHEVEQDLRRGGLGDADVAAVLALLDRAHAHSRARSDESWSAYDSLRRDMLAGPLREAVEPFPATRDHWQWAWWHDVVDFDPLPLWRDLDGPALVVYGAEDESDNVPVRASVARLREALTPERQPGNLIRVFEGSGHALGDSATGWIRDDFLELLGDWIREHVGAEQDRPSAH